MSGDIQRTQVDVSDDKSIRVYYSAANNLPPMPSVSVIKGLREDPQKEADLQGWRERFDGQSSWGRPWWRDQRQFKAYRGTLIHFAILSELGDAAGDTHYHEVGDDDWGREEYYAEYCLKKWSKKAPSANSDEVPYTPRNNKYDGQHAWDKAVRGMQWAARQFKQQIIDSGHLDRADVLAVEDFVYDQEYGYGGQYDLLYTDADGDTVLADLKTSSAIRFDHKLQSAAYRRAVESTGVTVDACEIIRLDPDSEEVVISHSDDWDRTLEGLEHEFLGLADRAHTVEYANALERAEVELLCDRTKTEQAELSESSA